MAKKVVTISNLEIPLDDWEMQIGRYTCAWMVLRALQGDQQAKDILDALGRTLYDNNGTQVWPVPMGPNKP